MAADTTYGNGEFLQWLADRSITPYMRTRDSIHRRTARSTVQSSLLMSPKATAISVAGQPINYGGRSHRNRAFLYRDPQTLWCVPAKTAMHSAASLPCHPPAQTSPQRTRVSQHARVRDTAAKKESGLVRGTQESDRAASLAPAEIEVRTGAVLPGSGGPEHQATSAVPQPTDNTGSARHSLAERGEEKLGRHKLAAEKIFCDVLFQHPRLLTTTDPVRTSAGFEAAGGRYAGR